MYIIIHLVFFFAQYFAEADKKMKNILHVQYAVRNSVRCMNK